MRRIKFVLWLLLAFCVNAEAQNKVGIVVGITGTARLKDTNGKEQKLTARNYFAVSLSVGQSLKADGQSKVQIKLCNGKTETVGSKWYRVSQVICSNTTNSGRREVFNSKFVLGGRYSTNRSNDDFILFPVQAKKAKKDCPTCKTPPIYKSVLRPETAVFRWMVTKEKLTLSVHTVGEGKLIWSQEVAGEPRSFTSDELKKALKDVREKQPNVKLRLKLSIAFLGTENSADFQIFSLKDEENLQKELAETNSEPGIFKHLARAEIYSRYKLYIEVANEYEEALKLSPESIELLMATAATQDRAGNFKRRDKIDEQIKILEKRKFLISKSAKLLAEDV